ncbi:hypothetical protein J4232_02385 [Candidatus Woesearchaeota archaeon]|nr:hypothetical protein [Candidatus Woesearchaeota archaeon]
MENNNIIKVLVAIIVIFIITTVVLSVKMFNPSITGNVVKGATEGTATDDKSSGSSGGILKNFPLKDKNGKSITETLGVKSTATVSNKDTINNLIELKSVSKNKDTVRIAELVTLVNRYIDENNDNNLLESWQRNVVGCVYKSSCSDTAYLQVIDAVASSNLDEKNNILMHGVVETANLWNNPNLVIFSDSLASTNRLVKEYGNANIKDQWNTLVACNGQCTDYMDKVFGLVKTINSNSN